VWTIKSGLIITGFLKNCEQCLPSVLKSAFYFLCFDLKGVFDNDRS
jgi:hypothetical protein